jgi:hypothetical protein
MSLFDDTEPLHKKAKEMLREYRIKDIFVPVTVQTEWQSRAMREHKRLVTTVIINLDKKKKIGNSSMSVKDLNILIDSSASEIRNNSKIEGRKLDLARSSLQREMAKAFKTPSGNMVTKRTTDDLKDYIIRLNYAFFDRGMNVIGFLIQHGYRHPDIKEEDEMAVKQFISKNPINMETQDSMILGDLLRYAVADSADYDFVVGDKDFYKKGQEYINSYDGTKTRVTFKFLCGV